MDDRSHGHYADMDFQDVSPITGKVVEPQENSGEISTEGHSDSSGERSFEKKNEGKSITNFADDSFEFQHINFLQEVSLAFS